MKIAIAFVQFVKIVKLDIHDEKIYELMTHFDIFISIYFTFLSNKFIKFNEFEGKCLRFTEKIQDYIFKLGIKEAIKALVKLGFEGRMRKGDHVVLKKGYRVFTVPLHSTLKKGTLRKILKQAGISVEEFNTLL